MSADVQDIQLEEPVSSQCGRDAGILPDETISLLLCEHVLHIRKLSKVHHIAEDTLLDFLSCINLEENSEAVLGNTLVLTAAKVPGSVLE